MYNSTRGLFPSYVGLGDIKVSLPTPARRSSLIRDTETLWNIHQTEPHATAVLDPGVYAPLPDENGFDPSKDLSEDSPSNVLINRGSAPISDEATVKLLERLNDIYTDMLVQNLKMSNFSAGEVKEKMHNEANGSLLVYNGDNVDSLIKAFTLIRSLELLIEEQVSSTNFIDEVKSKLLTFVNRCPYVRDAVTLPNTMISQRLFGSTELRNHIDHALESFGLNDVEKVETKENPAMAQFKDHADSIRLSESDLEKTILLDIANGVSSQGIDTVIVGILPHVRSDEIRNALSSVGSYVKTCAYKDAQNCAKRNQKVVDKLKSDLEELGIDSSLLTNLTQKEMQNRKLIDSKLSLPNFSSTQGASRFPNELKRVQQMLQQMISQQKLRCRQRALDVNTKLLEESRLYTLMCLHDCCESMSRLDNRLKDCAKNLQNALFQCVAHSNIREVADQKAKVAKAHIGLNNARKEKTKATLNKAKEDSQISNTKLVMLADMIG